MKKQTRKPRWTALLGVAVVLGLALGLIFAFSALPAQASPSFQGYPVGTETPTVTVTASPTVTLTGTLGAPARTGTPTSLLPVTGVDLTQQDGGGNSAGLWIAVWLLGLLLIWFGLRSRSSKQE